MNSILYMITANTLFDMPSSGRLIETLAFALKILIKIKFCMYNAVVTWKLMLILQSLANMGGIQTNWYIYHLEKTWIHWGKSNVYKGSNFLQTIYCFLINSINPERCLLRGNINNITIDNMAQERHICGMISLQLFLSVLYDLTPSPIH